MSNNDFLAKTGVEAIYRQALAAFPGAGSGTAAARTAVAAVMWRINEAGEFVVYMGKRARSLRFLPGRWSFPGGSLSDRDYQTPVAGAKGEAAARIAALVREVAEETGVVLPAQAHVFVPAGCLITPDFSPIRFEAWHYLIEVDNHIQPDHRLSHGEFEDGAWIRPSSALEHWRQCRWLISRPTRNILEALVPGIDKDCIDSTVARCTAAAERENQGSRMFEIVPGISLAPVRTPTLPPATHTNCYALGSRDLVIVDPASPYADEQSVLDQTIDALQESGQRVVEIWLTHHHGDHVGGAAHLAERLGVPVAAHERTAELLGSRVRVNRLLHDGDTIELQGDPPRRARAVFTPGHAPGHICVLEEHTGFLLTGDMVAGTGTIVIEPSEGHMGDYLRSLECMKKLAPAMLLPAHGPVIIDAAAKLDEYIAHRLWREQRVMDALRQLESATPRELVAVAYDDVPAAIHALAELSLVAHLIRLGEQGHAARQGDAWRWLAAGVNEQT